MPEHMTAPVLIIGIHRSGTSLLTRMLEAIGLFVGNDLQADHESLTMIELNNRYFMATNSSWDRPFYPTPAMQKNNIIRRTLDASVSVLQEHFGPVDGLWGFKDPRTLTTLPLWLEVFPEAPVIYIHRNEKAVARSLTKRHQRMIKKGIFPADGDFQVGNLAFTQRCSDMEGSLSFVHEQTSYFEALIQEGIVKDYHSLRYEDLLQNSEDELLNLMTCLGLEASKEAVTRALSLPRRD
ncbi:sulfotransferase [Kordiimonas sp.]|uniref:sulfotransferase n=1 Tax=Kordiimonas sp. TaxID=1970157 RepID=UPI003A93B550